MKIEEIKDNIKNKIADLASVTLDNKPHTIAVEVNEVKDNKIIITDNQMKNTPKDIKNNPNVSLVFWEGKKDEERGWRINGKAEYYDSGKYLDFVKSLKENKGCLTKGAIVIKVEEIKELG